MERIIGIDFGTSTTVIRYLEDGDTNTKEITDANGNKIIPTAVYKNTIGNYAYGCEAITAYETNRAYYSVLDDNLGQLFRNFKIDLLQPENSPEREQAKELILNFFKHILKQVKIKIPMLEYEPYDIAISYPAKWTNSMVTVMESILREAGFTPQCIIKKDEPTAAVFNMLHNHKRSLIEGGLLKVGKPLHIFMLDMGAGTTDIAIFRFVVETNGRYVLDQMLPYPPVDNPCLCGGKEIDELIIDYIRNYCKKYNVILDERDFNDFFAKKWKDGQLSDSLKRNEKSRLPNELVRYLCNEQGGRAIIDSFYFDRSVFESLTHEHWRNLYGLIKSAIEKYQSKYQIGAEDIDLLCLTGGHSKWYTVQKLFNGEGVFGSIGKIDDECDSNNVDKVKFTKFIEQPFRIEKFLDPNPHESVANGLCYIDDTIDIFPSSANNIWMQLVINDKESEVVEVVEQGMILPCTKKVLIDLGLIKKDFQSELQNEFRGYFKVFTGEKLNIDRFDKIEINLTLGLIEYFFGGDMYDIKSESTIVIGDDNTISISGEVTFEGQGGLYHPRKVVSFKNV